MSTTQYTLYKSEEDNGSIYLQMNDIKETCVEFWEQEGVKKTFVKVKIPIEAWEKIISDYKENRGEVPKSNERNI